MKQTKLKTAHLLYLQNILCVTQFMHSPLLRRQGSTEKLKKIVWIPKARQFNEFWGMIFTVGLTNWCVSLSCLPSGLQSCFQVIRPFPFYKIFLALLQLLTLRKFMSSFRPKYSHDLKTRQLVTEILLLLKPEYGQNIPVFRSS